MLDDRQRSDPCTVRVRDVESSMFLVTADERC